jgi:hypothetical protein
VSAPTSSSSQAWTSGRHSSARTAAATPTAGRLALEQHDQLVDGGGVTRVDHPTAVRQAGDRSPPRTVRGDLVDVQVVGGESSRHPDDQRGQDVVVGGPP